MSLEAFPHVAVCGVDWALDDLDWFITVAKASCSSTTTSAGDRTSSRLASDQRPRKAQGRRIDGREADIIIVGHSRVATEARKPSPDIFSSLARKTLSDLS